MSLSFDMGLTFWLGRGAWENLFGMGKVHAKVGSFVSTFAVGSFLPILLGLGESGPMLGLKLLVGPRWREFHCLAAPPWSL